MAAHWAMQSRLQSPDSVVNVDDTCVICYHPVHRYWYARDGKLYISVWMHEYAAKHPAGLKDEM